MLKDYYTPQERHDIYVTVYDIVAREVSNESTLTVFLCHEFEKITQVDLDIFNNIPEIWFNAFPEFAMMKPDDERIAWWNTANNGGNEDRLIALGLMIEMVKTAKE